MKKILLIILFTSIVIGICVVSGFFSLLPDLQSSSYTKDELIFADYSDTLYLKKRIEANKEIMVISTSSDPKFDPDANSGFIYDVSSSELFYKQTADSLIIYTRTLSKAPARFTSKVKISQIELTNPEMMKLISNKSYIKKGLKKID